MLSHSTRPLKQEGSEQLNRVILKVPLAVIESEMLHVARVLADIGRRRKENLSTHSKVLKINCVETYVYRWPKGTNYRYRSDRLLVILLTRTADQNVVQSLPLTSAYTHMKDRTCSTVTCNACS